MDEEMRARLAESRAKNFSVSIDSTDSIQESDFSLNVTHNGYQWTSIKINIDEAKQIHSALTDFIWEQQRR
jgi:hypothetical protein